MKYIFINPVIDVMSDSFQLDAFLLTHGYIRIYNEKDWISIVRDEYIKVLKSICDKKTLVDVRCPMIFKYINSLNKDRVVIPDIYPILINCAIELSENLKYIDTQKTIITPCSALSDFGNSLSLKNTIFISWKKFIKKINSEYRLTKKETPIPLGYFDCVCNSVLKISSDKQMQNFIENKKYLKYEMVEFLFCDGGCHFGDGIN